MKQGVRRERRPGGIAPRTKARARSLIWRFCYNFHERRRDLASAERLQVKCRGRRKGRIPLSARSFYPGGRVTELSLASGADRADMSLETSLDGGWIRHVVWTKSKSVVVTRRSLLGSPHRPSCRSGKRCKDRGDRNEPNRLHLSKLPTMCSLIKSVSCADLADKLTLELAR